jgi:sigma-B regulation protein RsbU (phosphoserine phosphatase)
VKQHSVRWFLVAVAAGFVLGLLLLVDSIYTFRFVVRPLVFDHLAAEAGQLVSGVEVAAGAASPADGRALTTLIGSATRLRSEEVAWIRIADQDGRILAAAGDASHDPLPRAAVDALVAGRAQRIAETRSVARGDVVVVTLPFRFQFPNERAARSLQQGGSGQPRFKIAEAALYTEGASGPFWPLRRALAVSLAGAIALLGAMTMFTLQLRPYLQAREVEQQLAVARRVQEELLPKECPGCGALDFAVEFVPALNVGGDFYDVFRLANGDVALVLGDVAGKGLPAAILMGVVHGAVRTASAAWTGANHSELTGHLNDLLYSRTAANRYVTMFWGFIDSDGQTLRYVNAGHLPPILLRPGDSGVQVERLEEGGPVLGLLPGTPYAMGQARLQRGDLVVAFSDGLSEATGATDEEFGTDRVIEAATRHLGRPPADVLAGILQSALAFTGGAPLKDDVSLLVVRAGAPRAEP